MNGSLQRRKSYRPISIDILEEDSVPVLNLHNNWEEYLGSLNKKRRRKQTNKTGQDLKITIPILSQVFINSGFVK